MSDRLLALALAEHEAGLHECGHPRSLALSPLSDGYFRVGHVQCNACAAADAHAKATSDGEPTPGVRALILNEMERGDRVRPWTGQLVTRSGAPEA